MFLSPWENPGAADGIPMGCWQLCRIVAETSLKGLFFSHAAAENVTVEEPEQVSYLLLPDGAKLIHILHKSNALFLDNLYARLPFSAALHVEKKAV